MCTVHQHLMSWTMDYLWNLLLKKKNVSSCGGGCQTTAKTMTIVTPRYYFTKSLSRPFFITICHYLSLLSSIIYLSIDLSIIIYISFYLSPLDAVMVSQNCIWYCDDAQNLRQK